MATPYSAYPIPQTGIGFHDSANVGSAHANVTAWAQALRAKGVTVYKILADGTNKVAMAAALHAAGIVPIVRLYGDRPHPQLTVHPGWVAPYVAVGARLFEWGNEPNIGSPEWEGGAFPPREQFGKLLGEQWLRNAAQIRAEGGIPMFVAMTPGGYHDHRVAYRQILDYLRGVGRLNTLEGAALAIHPRPHTVPPHVKPTEALTVAFKEYEWIAALFREYIGWVPPMYATEHGYSPDDHTPTGYPPINETQAAQYNRVLFEMMNPAHPDKCPPYLLGLCYWLETEGGTWVRDEAFKHRFPGEPRLWGQTFLSMAINWDRRAYVTGNAPAPEPPPNPTPPPPPPTPPQEPQWIDFTPEVRARLTYHPAEVAAGGRYWAIKSVRYLDEQAANGTHHIYSMNPHDPRFVTHISWAGGVANAPHEKPAGEPAANFPMFGEGFTARLQSPDNLPSDSVSGLGMTGNRHISFEITWGERTRSEPPPPTGVQMINLPSNHHSGRAGQSVKYIILHSTASPVGSTLASTAQYLKQNERGVSIHELVGENTVYLMVADNRAAHHCESETARLPGGEPNHLNNELTWGIEGFQIGSAPVSVGVKSLMLERVVAACRRLNVPASRVLAHREIDPTRRSDPLGIDMIQFRAAVASALGVIVQPAPTPPPVLWGKAAWAIEQAARILQSEGYTREHDVVLSDMSYAEIVAERDK